MNMRESGKASSVVRMTMADMAILADRRSDCIRLENADSYLRPPEHAIRATIDAVGIDRHNSYLPLDGLPELREAIAIRYETDLGVSYDPEDEIVVTSGAGEALLNVLLTFVDPGDRVLLTNPTYSGMAQRVRLAGGTQEFATLEERSGWHLDEGQLRKAAEGCKVFFFASPCMPTGTVLTKAETELLAELAEENDAIVLFNGAIDKVVFDGNSVTNPATLDRMRSRTIVVGCVSKNYNMMGWRIGWAMGPRDLMSRVHDVHIFNGIMPSGICQAGAAAALAGPQEYVAESVEIYRRNRDVLLEGLRQIPRLEIVTPEGGWFFLANVRGFGLSSTEFAERLLEEEDVAVTPMVAWGSDDFGHDHVRFIFANEPEDRLREAVTRIDAFCARIGVSAA
jgi:aspartate/methionine/tyrosine aminotransferase